MVLLIIDDDEDDVQSFKDAVGRIDSDIKVYSAEGGEKGLELLKSGIRPDYIFLDINMPGMNGKDVLIKIKANSAWNGIQIFMNSTTFNPKEIQEYRKIGCNGFVVKAGGPKQLEKDIRLIIYSK